MNAVIGGGGFSSRLMERAALRRGPHLRRRRRTSRCGAARARSWRRRSRASRDARAALDLLLAELERGRAEPPGEEELGWARTLAIGSFSMGLETSAAVVQALVDLDVYGLPEDSLDTFRARVRAVTPEDVERVARAHLHPERAAIVLVGPGDGDRAAGRGAGARRGRDSVAADSQADPVLA